MSAVTPPRGTTPRASRPGRGWPWAESAFPLGLVALGMFTLVDAAGIAAPGSANVIGPRVFPYGVGALLAGTGVAVLVSLVTGRHGEAQAGEDVDASAGTDWVTVATLTGSFAALVVLVEPLGWPVAATLLFGGAAGALGARPWWRPLLVGAVLALAVQVVFTQLLGVFLPAGPLAGVPFLG